MTLRSYLDQSGVRYQWLRHDIAYTAQDLAQREHIAGKKVIKPVVVEADGQFVLCALPATEYVNMKQLREQLHAKMARLADEQTMSRLFAGCEVGAEPPIGELFGMPTLVDDSLSSEQEVTFQAGTHQDAVRMAFGDYVRIARPKVAKFANAKKSIEDWEELI